MKLFKKNCSLINDNNTINDITHDNFVQYLIENKLFIAPKPISEGNYGYINILYDKRTCIDVLYIIKSEKSTKQYKIGIPITNNHYLLKIYKTNPIPMGILESYIEYILGQKLPHGSINMDENNIYINPLSKNLVINDFNSYGITLNKGDYFVSLPFVQEFLLMCETSKFLTNPTIYCIHFTDIYNLIKVGNEYKMIMEYICCGNLNIDGNTHLWGEFYSPELFLSIFFAIATYQTKGICHYDLHVGNILYIIVNEKYNPVWNCKNLLDYDYFEYTIRGISFYIPRPKIIIKIVDWGLGMKYSQPKIINANFNILTNLNRSKYLPVYDIAMIILSVNSKFQNKFHSGFMDKLTQIIFNKPPTLDLPIVILNELNNVNITAEDMILKYGLFDHLRDYPMSDNIIKVGNI